VNAGVGRPAPARVVMVVANDVARDSRVKKEALALAEGGLDIIVIGMTSDRAPHSEALGRAFLLRVPVQMRLRDERNRRRARRRRLSLPFLGYIDREARTAAERRVQVRRAEVLADSARARSRQMASGLGAAHYLAGAVTRSARSTLWRISGGLVRLRSGAGRRAYGLRDRLWNAWDRRIGKAELGARWRSVHPEIQDYEVGFGAALDALDADVLHAHDMHVLGVAVRAAWRARAAGRVVQVIYDAHEFVAGLAQYGSRTRRAVAAWADLEGEYIRDADRVITVGPAIAAALRERYGLEREPAVVLNAPEKGLAVGDGDSLRERLGLPKDVPLAVYSGGLNQARGVHVLIEAMRNLSDVHLAVVCVPHADTWYVHQLRAESARLGLTERVHFVDPVPSDQVAPFLSSADVGIHPMVGGFANHEMALPNKLFEYIHAGLPLVVTDLEQMGAFVRSRGIGEAFRSDDTLDLASKIRAVIANPRPYRAAVRAPSLRADFSWERQKEVLYGVYGELGHDALPTPPGSDAVKPSVRTKQEGRHLVIGPANMAGQGWSWARAVERNLASVRAEVLMVGRRSFQADHTVDESTYRGDLAWQVAQARRLLCGATHVLLEAGRPLAGPLNGAGFLGETAMLRSGGVEVGLILHGSEARDPRRHREKFPYTAFVDPADPETSRLQQTVDDVLREVAQFDGPVWVASPDLPDFVPRATWLPFVVDVAALRSDTPVLDRDRPIVVHAPTNAWLKGSEIIDPVLRMLDDQGVIEYRRIVAMPHDQLVETVRTCDIVVDQVRLGLYSVTSAEAMAAGRVTVAHVAPHVRKRLPGRLPIVEATPDDVEAVLRRLVGDRAEGVEAAAAGVKYARSYHDGREAARILAPFLGVGDDGIGPGHDMNASGEQL